MEALLSRLRPRPSRLPAGRDRRCAPWHSYRSPLGWSALLLALLAAPAVTRADNEACLACHAERGLVRETEYRKGTSVFVDPEPLAASVHRDLGCMDCHPDASEGHEPKLAPPACANCHGDVGEAYAGSQHGQAMARGEADAPQCGDCHGGHRILAIADTAATTQALHLPATCAACHADLDFIKRRPMSLASPLEAYEQSIHYKALRSGKHGATCSDCHESHDLRRPSDPRSAIYPTTVPATCGKCHAGIRATYDRSIHGQALARGDRNAPNCVDCHGEHEIRAPQDPLSRVYPSTLVNSTCVQCHESLRVTSRYGLSRGRLSSYLSSYHGLAERSGSTVVANCASCHGVHDILPSSDSLSSINKANLPRTCGKCHPGAGESFAVGTIHTNDGVANGEDPLVSYVRRMYVMLIVVVIGGMAVHNALDYRRNFKKGRLSYGTDYLRFTAGERLQHAVMALSFLTLAYTGFALKFPGSWWAVPLTAFGEGESLRRAIHRGAAVAMVAVCLYHVVYLSVTRRGRDQLVAMLPRLQDLRDCVQMVRYYLGATDTPPAFARFSYAEKAEYWALVWGSVVMSVTGFMLWFENTTLQHIPRWGLDLATTVHYYEAWLAALAIVVWHFYFVIFSPRVYPMSLVWWNGHMSEDEMAHEHPLELDRLRAEKGGGQSR